MKMQPARNGVLAQLYSPASLTLNPNYQCRGRYIALAHKIPPSVVVPENTSLQLLVRNSFDISLDIG